MNQFVEIKNLPEEKYRKLEERAASEGMSVADYVERLIENDIGQTLDSRMSISEVLELLKTRRPVHLVPSAVETIREDRDSRS